MKLTSLAVGTLATMFALLALSTLAVISAKAPASIRILFDLGDGTYVWANETVADPAAVNATWSAVQRAAQTSGVAIDATWFACCGVGISDLGHRGSPAGFVGLYRWNVTTRVWNFTSVGISSLVVSNGDAIALYNAGYDSVTFAGRTPVPTPDDPLPVLEFRGDLANSGSSPSTAPNRVQVRWDRDTGVREIGATPAVAYGKLFVNTRGGLVALDAGTGGVVWTSGKAKGFSSPAVFSNSVIVGTSNGTVVRLNASDGALQWETRLLTHAVFSGITSSPKVAFDWVFVGTFNETGGAGDVASLWASNGTVRWRHESSSVDYSSAAYADGTVYLGVMGRYNTTTQVTFDPPYGVLALNGNSGEQRWFFATNGSVAASPAIAGTSLIVPSKDGNVYAVDRTSGHEVWQASVGAGVSSAAVRGNTVFVGGGSFGAGGRVVALDTATGALRWSFEPNGPVQSSPTYADGKVIFATNAAQGTVYALNATDGTLLWSFTPTPAEYILGSPVVADGVVFAPSDNGHVYALAEASPGGHSVSGFPLVAVGAGTGVIVGVAATVWIVVRRRARGGR